MQSDLSAISNTLPSGESKPGVPEVSGGPRGLFDDECVICWHRLVEDTKCSLRFGPRVVVGGGPALNPPVFVPGGVCVYITGSGCVYAHL